jgi:hypothetical protein
MTVRPAKTTAVPAVPVARAMASSTDRPERSSVRNRERMNREHRGEDDRVLPDRGDGPVGQDTDEAEPDAEDGDEQVRPGGAHRAEGQDQDEEGDEHTDDLAGPGLGAQRHEVPAELDTEVGRCGLLERQGSVVGGDLGLVGEVTVGQGRHRQGALRGGVARVGGEGV